MRPIHHDSYVTAIDKSSRVEVVRSALGDARARMRSWRAESMGGGGSGSEVYRVHGLADSGVSTRPWNFILKMFNHEGEGWQQSSTDPNAWDFWKREWLVYQRPWLQQLNHGVVAPHCFGFGEVGDTAAWVAMEDLSSADKRPWPISQFVTAAKHLGQFNGCFLRKPRPSEPWFSRGWIQGWTERAEPMITQLPALADHPAVAELLTPSTVDLLVRVWEHRHAIYQVLDALPQSICHLDLFPRNAFARQSNGHAQTVAIDWAYCGWAAVGADLAPLIGASLNFLELDWDQGDDLERRCVDTYLAQLRSSGCSASRDEVFIGYLATIALRYMVGAAGPLLTTAMDETLTPLVERMFGYPKPTLVATWYRLNAFNAPRLAYLLATLGCS